METSALTAPRLVSVEDGAEDDVFGQLSVTGVTAPPVSSCVMEWEGTSGSRDLTDTSRPDTEPLCGPNIIISKLLRCVAKIRQSSRKWCERASQESIE